MMTKHNEIDESVCREVNRQFYRNGLSGVFWTALQRRRKMSGYRLQDLANVLKINKSTVSRWFSSNPNWEANTVADIASALDLDIHTFARDKITGEIYTSTGPTSHAETVVRVHVSNGKAITHSNKSLANIQTTGESLKVEVTSL